MSRTQDLTGRKFGMLTVLERTDRLKDRYFVWRCRCDCGKETFVDTKRLTRGTIKNCGCIPKTTARNGTIAEDLTGRTFGRLTVLYRTENRRSRTFWVCRCSCGKLCSAAAHDLKAGKNRSCGCLRRISPPGFTDIAGRKFGRLTALYVTPERDKKGSVFWHCRCDCGTELEVTENNLVHGNYQSCGCLRREIWAEIPNRLHRIDGTCIEWLESRKHRCDNTSGFRGVNETKNGKYRVSIGFKRQRFYVGTFDTFNEAVEARLEVEEQIHDGFVKAYRSWQQQAEEDPDWAGEHPLVFDVEKGEGDFRIITS
ncbi:MAG: transcriptional regulator [Eubacteriales bacterium]|nr:transcriptional regulator [Eubacteriales bacterium]